MNEWSHEDIMDRLARGDERFDDLDTALKTILERTADLPAMKQDLSKTKEIVEAWAAVKNLGRFVEWLSKVIAALAVIGSAVWAAMKIGGGHLR